MEYHKAPFLYPLKNRKGLLSVLFHGLTVMVRGGGEISTGIHMETLIPSWAVIQLKLAVTTTA